MNIFNKTKILLAILLGIYGSSPKTIASSTHLNTKPQEINHKQAKPLLLPVIMVKNEESVIGKTLQPFVDAGIKDFFVFDTGSTDDTVNVTKQFFKKNNLNGVIAQEPFIDFCTSRNRALKLAEQAFPNAAFMIMPDAEWYLKNAHILLDFCQKHVNDDFDLYGVRIINTSNLDYLNQRLFKCGKNGHFQGAVHEYSMGYEGPTVPLEVYFEWAPTPQGVEKSRGRWMRDRDILIREHNKDPQDPRTVFYLAQTYECLGDQENARLWYEKRTEMFGFDEERYVAHCRLARIYETLGNWPRALELDLKAYSERPHRAESLIHIALHYYTDNKHPLCYLFSRHAAEMPYPSKDILFIEKNLYDFTRYDLLGVGAWHMGDLTRGRNAVLQALQARPYDTHLLRNLVLFQTRQKETSKSYNPLILNLHFGTPEPGGIESHLVMFNKIFEQHSINTKILTSPHAAYVVNTVNKSNNSYGQQCATYKHNDFIPRTGDIIEQDPSVVICNYIGQLSNILAIRQFMPIKVIYVQHNFYVEFTDEELKMLNQVDGIVGVSPMVTEYFKTMKEKGRLNVPHITTIAPFFDEQRFVDFKPTRTRSAYFKQEFNINIAENTPVISMIANMFYYKNQALLINAVAALRSIHNIDVHLMLAGTGPDFEQNKALVESLNMQGSIHFLGKVLNTQELLHNSTLHLLASSFESFGVAHMEAALMHKPFIAATKTGIASYIHAGHNGIIFENNNLESLTYGLRFLLENPNAATKMGEEAYKMMREEFSGNATFKKWQNFLTQVI